MSTFAPAKSINTVRLTIVAVLAAGLLSVGLLSAAPAHATGLPGNVTASNCQTFGISVVGCNLNNNETNVSVPITVSGVTVAPITLQNSLNGWFNNIWIGQINVLSVQNALNHIHIACTQVTVLGVSLQCIK